MKKIFGSYSVFLVTLCFVSCSKENEEIVQEPFLNVADFSAESAELPRMYKSDHFFIGSLQVEHNVNSQLTYTLKDENPKGALKIGEFGGIQVNTLAYFDYEFFPIISARVDVTNGAIKKTVSINVNLRDINEGRYFVYQDKEYGMWNLRENLSSFESRLTMISQGMDFSNSIGAKGIGDFLSFTYQLESFDKDKEVNEGVVLYGSDNPKPSTDYIYLAFQKNFSTGWSYDDLIKKEIRKGKLHYKRSPAKNESVGGRDVYAFKIDFFFYLTDGTIINGGYEAKGISQRP